MTMLNHDDADAIKHVVDTVSVITVVGTLVDALPAIAALFTIIWTGIRIYESDTVQRFISRFKGKSGG